MRIVFAGGGTGGHLYPGLAIARALVRLDARVTPFFVGARRGIEREVLPRTEFEHVLLDLHPLYRARVWENWRTVAGLAGAWRALHRALGGGGQWVSGAGARADVRARPAVVVGTGGYASGATLAWAVTHGVPTVLQEQNSHPGITTRFFSRWAREIYLSYGEAAGMLHPRTGTWVGETGNPIEPPAVPRPDRAAARARWGFPPSGGSVLLVFGGSQGARAINDAMATWVERGLPERMYVIWATGTRAHERYAHLSSERVRVEPYLAPIAEAYAASDLAVARSGALTLAELCAWGIPSVLVPLPTAAADHQTSNARALERAGAAVVVPQTELGVDRLAGEVHALIANPARLGSLAAGATQRGHPEAAETIARRVLALGSVAA